MKMDLIELRRQIDQVDGHLVALLEKRMELVQAVANYKKEHQLLVLDSNREKEVIMSIASQIQNPNYKEAILASVQAIMDQSKVYQEQRLSQDD